MFMSFVPSLNFLLIFLAAVSLTVFHFMVFLSAFSLHAESSCKGLTSPVSFPLSGQLSDLGWGVERARRGQSQDPRPVSTPAPPLGCSHLLFTCVP